MTDFGSLDTVYSIECQYSLSRESYEQIPLRLDPRASAYRLQQSVFIGAPTDGQRLFSAQATAKIQPRLSRVRAKMGGTDPRHDGNNPSGK